MAASVPATARACQFSKTGGGFENHMAVNVVPVPKPKPHQHLVRVVAVALNPVDYKAAEVPLAASILSKLPATPGADFAGEIAIPAAGSALQPGQLVFGQTGLSLVAAAAPAEYAVASKDLVVPVPAGVSPAEAASLPIGGVTAYQSIHPYVKTGDHVFINGGSGGTGLCGIQIAKILGCHVTTTCSTKNIELCKAFGADEVLDYTAGPLLPRLTALPYKFDHVVDNVGADTSLYLRCDGYTTPAARWMYIGVPEVRPGELGRILRAKLTPGFLGGSTRKLVVLQVRVNQADLTQLAAWVAEGKLKVNIDERFPLDRAADAYRKLKTHRTVGKIIVDVAEGTPTASATQDVPATATTASTDAPVPEPATEAAAEPTAMSGAS